MRFLKTLFWVLVAVIVALFAGRNWFPVTVNLWGGLQADIKLPVLLAITFLLGFLPPLLIYRARLWSLRREQMRVPPPPPAPLTPPQREPDPLTDEPA